MLKRYTYYEPDSMKIPPPLDRTIRPVLPIPNEALLLNPFYPKDPVSSFGKHVLTPSQALISIAAATPANWRVRYWDENLLQGHPPVEPFPQVVGITVHLTFAQRAFELARWYRERGSVVVLGGLHTLSCPEECESHADAIAIGEGVEIWPDILRDVETHQLKKRYVGSYHKPFREVPPPRRDILPTWGFLTNASLVATRGCHNRCGFCYLSTKGLRMPYQTRNAEDVAREFVKTNEPYGVFIDNNLGSNKAYLWDLCRALRKIEKIWSAAVSIDVTDDPALVREMALAGCTGVFVGFETLNEVNLNDARKKSPTPDDYARRVELFHDCGIQVNGSFVLGFDQDTKEVFDQTIHWIEINRLECATFHILTPYPGTPLFRHMKQEGRLLHENWDEYDTAHVVFRPRQMSVEELEEGYRECYRRLFSYASIWKRRPVRAASVPGYLAMSLLYKKSNRLWPWLIKHRLTHRVWKPIIELARFNHLRFRERLACQTVDNTPQFSITLGI